MQMKYQDGLVCHISKAQSGSHWILSVHSWSTSDAVALNEFQNFGAPFSPCGVACPPARKTQATSGYVSYLITSLVKQDQIISNDRPLF